MDFRELLKHAWLWSGVGSFLALVQSWEYPDKDPTGQLWVSTAIILAVVWITAVLFYRD